jgi:hypothetical protein
MPLKRTAVFLSNLIQTVNGRTLHHLWQVAPLIHSVAYIGLFGLDSIPLTLHTQNPQGEVVNNFDSWYQREAKEKSKWPSTVAEKVNHSELLLENEREKLGWDEVDFHDTRESSWFQFVKSVNAVLREIVLCLLSFVLDLAAPQQAITGIFRQFFLGLLVAFHVIDITNSLSNVSDHEKLSAAANSDGFVSQAFKSAVVSHVFLEELQRFLSLQVAVASEVVKSRMKYKNLRTTSNLFGS